MKYLFLPALLLIFSSCGEQKTNTGSAKKEEAPADTLPKNDTVEMASLKPDSVIVDHAFTDEPFHEKNTMAYFESIKNRITKTEKELRPSEYDASVTDTVKKIYYGKSVVETLQNAGMETPMLLSVEINDRNMKLKNGIELGLPAQRVFEAFDVAYDDTKTYKFLNLHTPGDEGATSDLVFYFKDNTLVRIVFWPYAG